MNCDAWFIFGVNSTFTNYDVMWHFSVCFKVESYKLFIFVINLFDLPGNNLLKKKGYKTESLIEFPGH